jgi:hypothetical protein
VVAHPTRNRSSAAVRRDRDLLADWCAVKDSVELSARVKHAWPPMPIDRIALMGAVAAPVRLDDSPFLYTKGNA